MDNAVLRLILIVEDGVQGIDWSTVTLEGNSYFFIHCSGTQALEVSRYLKADLFLIHYPSSSGRGTTLCQQLRALPGLHDVPVIVTQKHLGKDEMFQMLGLLTVA